MRFDGCWHQPIRSRPFKSTKTKLPSTLTAPSFDSGPQTIQVTVAYDRETLRGPHVEVCQGTTSDPTPHVAVSTKGKQVAYFDLKRTLPRFAGTSSTDVVERGAESCRFALSGGVP